MIVVVVVIRGIEYARSLTGTERETRRVRTFEGRSSSESYRACRRRRRRPRFLYDGRTSGKPERKGAKKGEARTISNVNTYLIVAFPSKPRSFLPRDDSRDRSQEREGEGERETKGRKDGKGKIGGREGERERKRERERA